MKLYTINATPIQSFEQMLANYNMEDDETVAHINELHMAEYPTVVADILKSHDIDGFTIYQVQGYWKGEAEVSFKIEIATELSHFMVGEICNELRDTYNQDSVMLTLPDNTVEFI